MDDGKSYFSRPPRQAEIYAAASSGRMDLRWALVQAVQFAPFYLGLNVVKLQAATSPVTTLIKMVFAMTIGPDKPKAQARLVSKPKKMTGSNR